MNSHTLSRRKLLIAASATALQALPVFASSPVDRAGAEAFLRRWDAAWNRHDAEGLGVLHTEDAVTVNRFGTMVSGRASVTQAFAFLHAPGGPFSKVELPPQSVLSLRQIAPGVLSLQSAWKCPVMHPDGKLDLSSWEDMIVSFLLVQRGPELKATDVDLHNVEKIDLPFANPGQKR